MRRHPGEPRFRTRRPVRAALGVTATLALLAGCGRGNSDEANAVDTEYATSLVNHHAQTLQLLDLTLGRDGLDPRVGTFADQARSELFAEVNATTKRLEGWGEKVPKTALEHTHDNTHDNTVTHDTSIAGVLSNDEMHALEQAEGQAFEQAWLRELIAHEEGAVELATEAAEAGQNATAVTFAEEDKKVHEGRVADLRRLVK